MSKKEHNTLTNKDFFFCYSPYLARFLQEHGAEPITVALNPNNMDKYTMFLQSDELNEMINNYRNKAK